MYDMYTVIQLSFNYTVIIMNMIKYVLRGVKWVGNMLGIETQYVLSLFKWLTWLWYFYHQVPFLLSTIYCS